MSKALLPISRRALLGSAAIGAGLMLSGCDRVNSSPAFRRLLGDVEGWNKGVQRSLADRMALAREFDVADISPEFRANGTRDPGTPAYQAHVDSGFADWRITVDGLVATPLSLSVADIKSLPQRRQITRHDCVEGWSAIGQWQGVPLKLVLEAAGLDAKARFIVFHCADLYNGFPYYESIDLIDAFHPQTILAHSLNGGNLPVANGAPVRLRVERQLGYKHAKYIERIEAVEGLDGIGLGKGGYWEDRGGYAWYAGI